MPEKKIGILIFVTEHGPNTLILSARFLSYWFRVDLGILRAGSGSGRAKKSLVFFLAARARPDSQSGRVGFGSGRAGSM